MSVINTNYLSMVAQSNLSKSQSSLGTAIERLSSGLRINSAKDDAAGQAIANRMTSQIKGLTQAQRNANDGISAAQTAEGALNQVNDNLQRIRELTVQAANGTNSGDDLTSIQNEIDQRLSEINRISDETTFNGTKVLAKDESLKIQVGAKDNEIIKIGLQKIDVSSLKLEGFNVDGNGAVANKVATKDSLTLAGATLKAGSDNEYIVATPNGNVTASSLLSKAKSGDVVRAATVDNTEVSYAKGNVADVLGMADGGFVITGLTNGPAGAAGSYTFNADNGVYDYTQTITGSANAEAALNDALKAGLGETIKASIQLGSGSEVVNVVIDDQGFIKNENGDTLYLDKTGGSENLTATNNGTMTAAKVDELATLLSGGIANGAEIEVGEIVYGVANDGAITVTGQSLTTKEVAALIDNQGVAVTIETGADSQDIRIDGTAGTVEFINDGDFANGKVYLTEKGELSDKSKPTVSGFDSAYTFNAEKGAFTYSATTAYDATDANSVGTSAAKATLKAAMTAAEGETVKATITLGGKSTDVVIDSKGGLKAAASGKELFLDNDGNLTETNAAASDSATIDNVAQSILKNGAGTVAIEGGAAYTAEKTGTNGTLKADGLTASADVVADRLDNNIEGTFEYVIADFDGKGTSQTVKLDLGSDGQVAEAHFVGGVMGDTEAYVGAEGKLTDKATENASYFMQENGEVHNGAGQRIYEDGKGGFTTKDVTAGGRTENALSVLDDALKTVDALRSDLGAIQNRFESAIDNLNTTATNLSAARSRIEDADYAVEVANMTRSQILQQAGTSVLAQANQIPQGVLSLLG